MKKLIFILLCLPVISLLSSCHQIEGKGPVVSQTRSVTSFNAVEATVSGDTEISIGPVCSVKIEGQQNIIDIIETSVKDGKLTISTKDSHGISSRKGVIIHITMPEVTELNLTGSGELKVLNDIKTKSLTMDITGSGDLETASITADELNATLTGSGNLKIAGGNAKKTKLMLTGTGDANCIDLLTGITEVNSTGSGNADVNADEQLKVDITGSGDVNYKGKAQVNSTMTGSGSLHKKS